MSNENHAEVRPVASYYTIASQITDLINKISDFPVRFQGDHESFTVPTTGVWLDVFIMNGASITSEIGGGPRPRRTGLVSIYVRDRIGKGIGDILKACDNVVSVFEYASTDDVSFRESSLVSRGYTMGENGKEDMFETYEVTTPFYTT